MINLTLEKTLGCGHLRAAGWLDDGTVLAATDAGLWRWNLQSGAITLFARLGATLLSINRKAGLAAAALECPERELAVVSLRDGQVIRRLPGHGGNLLLSLALSPDGGLLACGGSDRMVDIWEVATGEKKLSLEHPGGFSSMDGNPDALAWSPDGSRLATACENHSKQLWLWDAVSGAKLGEFTLPLEGHALAFSPDGRTIAAALRFGGGCIARSDRFLAVVDARTGVILATPDSPDEDGGRGEDIWAAAFSPDGQLCAAGDETGAVHIYETASWQRVKRLADPDRDEDGEISFTISGLEFSPDGSRLLQVATSEVNRGEGAVEQALRVWDTHTWESAAWAGDFVSEVRSLDLLPNGSLLAATDEGLRRYSADGRYETILKRNLHCAAAAPDGSRVVVGYHSFKGEARLLDLQSGEAGELLPNITKARLHSGAFLSDSQRFVVCHDNFFLRQVGRKTNLKTLPPLEANRVDHLSAAASCDGKVAFVSWTGDIAVMWGNKLEQSTGWQPHPGLSRRLNAAAFSPDGWQVAAASGYYQREIKTEDKTGRIYIWSLPEMTVRELATPTSQRWFDAIAWSADGKWIAAGSRNGIICLFDARSGVFAGEFSAHGDEVTALRFTGEGRLISASTDGSIAIWRFDG